MNKYVQTSHFLLAGAYLQATRLTKVDPVITVQSNLCISISIYSFPILLHVLIFSHIFNTYNFSVCLTLKIN